MIFIVNRYSQVIFRLDKNKYFIQSKIDKIYLLLLNQSAFIIWNLIRGWYIWYKY